MANQYSITVSDRADAVLKDLKEKGFKTSQGISIAIELLGSHAIGNLIARNKQIEMLQKEDDDQ
jgi:hypothetical protein